jgi:hypothetical protein
MPDQGQPKNEEHTRIDFTKGHRSLDRLDAGAPLRPAQHYPTEAIQIVTAPAGGTSGTPSPTTTQQGPSAPKE